MIKNAKKRTKQIGNVTTSVQIRSEKRESTCFTIEQNLFRMNKGYHLANFELPLYENQECQTLIAYGY